MEAHWILQQQAVDTEGTYGGREVVFSEVHFVCSRTTNWGRACNPVCSIQPQLNRHVKRKHALANLRAFTEMHQCCQGVDKEHSEPLSKVCMPIVARLPAL